MTQAYINTFKPRPHFEDVVFGNRDRSKLYYPQRAYIIRDSLYYGVEDKEKLQQEERVKAMESNLKLLGQDVNMTLPQMREIMKDMLGSELPGKVNTFLTEHNERVAREKQLKREKERVEELKEKADDFRRKKMRDDIMKGLKQNVNEREEAARKIQSIYRQLQKTTTNDPQPPSLSSSSQQPNIQKPPRGRPPKNTPRVPNLTPKATGDSFTGGPAETAKLRSQASIDVKK